MDDLIRTYTEAPVGNPPQSIWQYEYNGALVYYVPPQCCDQYSDLYDFAGKIIREKLVNHQTPPESMMRKEVAEEILKHENPFVE